MGRSEFLEGKLYQADYFQTKMLKNQIFLSRLLLYKERKLMENNFAHCFLFKYHDFALFLNNLEAFMDNLRCSVLYRFFLVSDRMSPSNGFIPFVLQQQRREPDWQDKTLPVGKVVKRQKNCKLYIQEVLTHYVY